jgi:hypothetical protein
MSKATVPIGINLMKYGAVSDTGNGWKLEVGMPFAVHRAQLHAATCNGWILIPSQFLGNACPLRVRWYHIFLNTSLFYDAGDSVIVNFFCNAR